MDGRGDCTSTDSQSVESCRCQDKARNSLSLYAPTEGVVEASWHLVPLTLIVPGCHGNCADQAIVFSALMTNSVSLGMLLMLSDCTSGQISCFQMFLTLSNWKLFPILPISLSFCAAFQNCLFSVTGFIADLNRLCRLSGLCIYSRLWLIF